MIKAEKINILTPVKRTLLFALCFFFPVILHASALGMPKSTTYLGFGTNISQVYVNDSAGDTKRIISAQPTSVFISDWLYKNTRYLSEVYINNYAFEANNAHLGEEASQFGLRLSVQTHRQLLKSFAPWLGAGLDISTINFEKRHRVDDEGYLTTLMSDSKSTGVNLLLNAMHTWKLDDGLVAATKLEYSLPLTQSVSGVSVSFILFFKPIQ